MTKARFSHIEMYENQIYDSKNQNLKLKKL